MSGVFIVLEGIDGSGKCFGPGTEILMFNGSIKKVEEITPGDLVMGDDSTPRTVTSTTSGEDDLYKIIPKKGGGEAYVVNSSHVLCLVIAGKTSAYRKHAGKDGIIEMTVDRYLQQSLQFRRHALSYHAIVDFPYQAVKIDPYFLGVWLGDGNTCNTGITKPDQEIIDCVKKEAQNRKEHYKCRGPSQNLTHFISSGHSGVKNSLIDDLRAYHLLPLSRRYGTDLKHIPTCYLANSKEVRLQLLAGILDTDGHMRSGGFEITLKNQVLAKGVALLARSLGFAVSTRFKTSRCQTGAVGTYLRLNISGNCNSIPTRISRKQAPARRINKDPMRHGFCISPQGRGKYFGFTVDGNHRFLLGDCTVTHNSTQAKLLEEALRTQGYPVKLTREPGGSSIGIDIRELLKENLDPFDPMDEYTELFLLMADRAAHVKRVIQPALDQGMTVICDRYTASTIAYQGYGKGIPLNALHALNQIVTHGLTQDLSILLDCSVSEASRRLALRGGSKDPYDHAEIALRERIAKGYKAIFPPTAGCHSQKLLQPQLSRLRHDQRRVAHRRYTQADSFACPQPLTKRKRSPYADH